jgi:RNA recognition motif. (a.k.a. RRM, RBD, or RNP domain)
MIRVRASHLVVLSSCFAAEAHALVVLGNTLGRRPPSFFQYPCQLSRSSPSICYYSTILRNSNRPDFTVIDNDSREEGSSRKEDVSSRAYSTKEWGGKKRESFRAPVKASSSKPFGKRPPKLTVSSWMQKNAAFVGDETDNVGTGTQDSRSAKNRTFRQDFRGTRVFVQGIPPGTSWQDLKDHFAVAGSVVFASVSVDPVTGKSKGVGIVQFETSEMAANAISIMRNHPMSGSALFVREDVQEQRGEGRELKSKMPVDRRDTPPSIWECADDENSSVLSEEERESVVTFIQARDAARRRKNYDASDEIREELKAKFGVHLDDRLKQWWVSFDGGYVPQNVRAVKGEGRWGGKTSWRQIPTTPENDACVNPDLVNGLLTQRDIARREKDFSTADALLEEARTSPDGDLYLRIHDESRTWRIWTDQPPPRPFDQPDDQEWSAADQCIALVREKAPHKEEEIKALLEKFPGREYPILKKLRKSLKDAE